MKLVIRNGRIVDTDSKREYISDLLIEEGIITKIAFGLESEGQEIDASGCYIFPGFIDMHVHLRDPGLLYKETLETGMKAAAKGGVTTLCAMPNTIPVIDSTESIIEVHTRAKEQNNIDIIQLGAITKGQKGQELTDIGGMAIAGCKGISEDGKSVMDENLYKRAMEVAKENNVLVLAHCEDIELVRGGVMNAGKKATELGLLGITNEVEDVIVERDIRLAKETKVKLHLCHCSTEKSVELLALGKKEGVHVTGEVCPHHFILTEDDIVENHGRYKMNPPLRTKEDREALVQGLKDGTIDVIATDHAPHATKEKDVPIEEAAFGIVGLETLASLTYTELVKAGHLTLLQMIEKLCMNPADILGLADRGRIAEGKRADIVIFDPNYSGTIDKKTFLSKGKNTPFHGRAIEGEVRMTIANGKIVYEKGGEA